MQYTKVKISEMDRFVVFDQQLRLVEPINDYLEFQRKIGRAENTIHATAMDLMRFWEFMDENYYVWTDLSVDMIAEYHTLPAFGPMQISSTNQSPGRTDSMSFISFLRASYFTFVSPVGIETGSAGTSRGLDADGCDVQIPQEGDL